MDNLFVPLSFSLRLGLRTHEAFRVNVNQASPRSRIGFMAIEEQEQEREQ
jgi:hypothetical protein